MKIKFIKNTGNYKEGDTIETDKLYAVFFIQLGFATEVVDTPKPKPKSKTTTKKTIKKTTEK